ncbi:hypothetical protein Y032_0003g1446 [Ancylostoma ceylanicum]|uniref:Uncharacterized protein n=1 Tax=Ancylostoma ceylanicum TaxID=53326 RepID=A0A016VXP1_9BILA|nr:hypothetical protein Y032_0003g1446 [Ancylostoma ceylanicum]
MGIREAIAFYSFGKHRGPYAPSVESFRARRACGACAACPACNSGPGSSISCSRTALLAFGPDQYSRSSHL